MNAKHEIARDLVFGNAQLYDWDDRFNFEGVENRAWTNGRFVREFESKFAEYIGSNMRLPATLAALQYTSPP